MHLVIDGRSVHPQMGGIGRATLDLVRELGANPRGHRISMIVGVGHSGELAAKGVRFVPADAAMIDEPFEQLQLPCLLQQLGCDVYLNTTFSVPAIKTTKVQMSIVHDVVFEDCPEYVEPGLRDYLSRWSRFAAEQGDHVLTVSDHARERIQAVYGIAASRITRVYNGISPSWFSLPDHREVERVRTKLGLQEPFILYLGSIEPKKGIPQLLRAYRQAVDLGIRETLVLAGGRGGPSFDLEDEIRAVGCVGRVRALGFVKEVDKQPLMQASSLFVYPSLYEGFGIPPVEALAMGLPCVVSNQTSLPEVCGDAALLADVNQPGLFAGVLVQGVRDSSFREEALVKGPIRARQFTWEKSAAQVLDLCERLGGN